MLPSICFLDIRMPGCCGLDVAQALAEEWPEDASFPLLVFVTAYDEYAVRAFERQAVDYLLKPIEPARLAECCRRLRERLAERGRARPRSPDSGAADQHAEALARAVEQLRGLLGATLDAGSANAAHAGHAADAGEGASADGPLRLIQAQRGQTLHLVPVDEVVYFEAADKYVRVVTPEHEWLIRTPLRELLERLDTEAFWQIHRATVVQARQVESVQRDARGRLTVRLRSRPELLPVSRLYASRFRPLRSFGPGPRHRTRE